MPQNCSSDPGTDQWRVAIQRVTTAFVVPFLGNHAFNTPEIGAERAVLKSNTLPLTFFPPLSLLFCSSF